MINTKSEVFEAIKKVEQNVTDMWPDKVTSYPAICYIEEENKVYEFTDDKEDKSYVRYRIDIFNNASTSKLAIAIDTEISKLGLKRIQCQDVTDVSDIRHKCIRYEGIVDNVTEHVYKNN